MNELQPPDLTQDSHISKVIEEIIKKAEQEHEESMRQEIDQSPPHLTPITEQFPSSSSTSTTTTCIIPSSTHTQGKIFTTPKTGKPAAFELLQMKQLKQQQLKQAEISIMNNNIKSVGAQKTPICYENAFLTFINATTSKPVPYTMQSTNPQQQMINALLKNCVQDVVMTSHETVDSGQKQQQSQYQTITMATIQEAVVKKTLQQQQYQLIPLGVTDKQQTIQDAVTKKMEELKTLQNHTFSMAMAQKQQERQRAVEKTPRKRPKQQTEKVARKMVSIDTQQQRQYGSVAMEISQKQQRLYQTGAMATDRYESVVREQRQNQTILNQQQSQTETKQQQYQMYAMAMEKKQQYENVATQQQRRNQTVAMEISQKLQQQRQNQTITTTTTIQQKQQYENVATQQRENQTVVMEILQKQQPRPYQMVAMVMEKKEQCENVATQQQQRRNLTVAMEISQKQQQQRQYQMVTATPVEPKQHYESDVTQQERQNHIIAMEISQKQQQARIYPAIEQIKQYESDVGKTQQRSDQTVAMEIPQKQQQCVSVARETQQQRQYQTVAMEVPPPYQTLTVATPQKQQYIPKETQQQQKQSQPVATETAQKHPTIFSPKNQQQQQPSTSQYKPNMVWANFNYYQINNCETLHTNQNKFYPLTMEPIQNQEMENPDNKCHESLPSRLVKLLNRVNLPNAPSNPKMLNNFGEMYNSTKATEAPLIEEKLFQTVIHDVTTTTTTNNQTLFLEDCKDKTIKQQKETECKNDLSQENLINKPQGGILEKYLATPLNTRRNSAKKVEEIPVLKKKRGRPPKRKNRRDVVTHQAPELLKQEEKQLVTGTSEEGKSNVLIEQEKNMFAPEKDESRAKKLTLQKKPGIVIGKKSALQKKEQRLANKVALQKKPGRKSVFEKKMKKAVSQKKDVEGDNTDILQEIEGVLPKMIGSQPKEAAQQKEAVPVKESVVAKKEAAPPQKINEATENCIPTEALQTKDSLIKQKQEKTMKTKKHRKQRKLLKKNMFRSLPVVAAIENQCEIVKKQPKVVVTNILNNMNYLTKQKLLRHKTCLISSILAYPNSRVKHRNGFKKKRGRPPKRVNN